MAHLKIPGSEIGADDDLAAAKVTEISISGSGSHDRFGLRIGGCTHYKIDINYEMLAGDKRQPSRLYKIFHESISWDNKKGGDHPEITVMLDKQVGDERTIVDEITLSRVLPKRYRRVYNRKRKTITESFHAIAYELNHSDTNITVELNADLDS